MISHRLKIRASAFRSVTGFRLIKGVLKKGRPEYSGWSFLLAYFADLFFCSFLLFSSGIEKVMQLDFLLRQRIEFFPWGKSREKVCVQKKYMHKFVCFS